MKFFRELCEVFVEFFVKGKVIILGELVDGF